MSLQRDRMESRNQWNRHGSMHNQLKLQQLICNRKSIGTDGNQWIGAQHARSPLFLGVVDPLRFKLLKAGGQKYTLTFECRFYRHCRYTISPAGGIWREKSGMAQAQFVPFPLLNHRYIPILANHSSDVNSV